MKRKYRYLLLLLGFVAFFILSPILITLVRGVWYHTDEGRFVETGIFTIKSKPAGAELYINGRSYNDTPADVRFLTAGEYEAELQLADYLPWRKRFTIKSGQVTLAEENDVPVQLLKKTNTRELAQNVADVERINDNLWIAGNKYFAQISGNTVTRFPLASELVDNIASGNSNRYIGIAADGAFKIFDTSAQKFTSLSLPTSNLKNVFVTNNGVILLSHDNTILFKSLDGKQEKIIATNSASFTVQGDLLYILETSQIISLSLESLDKEPVLLADKIDAFKNGTLLVMPHKEIFCLLDNTLYQVGTPNLTRLQNEVTSAGLDTTSESLWWQTGGAIYYYEYGFNGPKLITRSQSPITALAFHPESRYLFYIQEQRLQATELQNESPNEYTLTTVSDGRTLINDPNTDRLYILDGDRLLSLDF